MEYNVRENKADAHTPKQIQAVCMLFSFEMGGVEFLT
jgi:hypothetical protein